MKKQAKRNDKGNDDVAPAPKLGKGKHRNPNSLANLKPIQPGEVRNPKGWPKGKRHTDTLFELAMERFGLAILDTINTKRKLKKQSPLTLEDAGVDPELDMLMKQIEKARNGDTKAFEIIWGYRHGKPTARVEVAGDPDNPIKHEHEFAEAEVEVASWMEGWFGSKKTTKVAVKKKPHGDKATDTRAAQ